MIRSSRLPFRFPLVLGLALLTISLGDGSPALAEVIVTASVRTDTFPSDSTLPVEALGEADFGGLPFTAPLNLTMNKGIELEYSVRLEAIDENVQSSENDVYEAALRYANDFGDINVANFGSEQVFTSLETNHELTLAYTGPGLGFQGNVVEVEVQLIADGSLRYESSTLAGFSSSISYVARAGASQHVAISNLSAEGFRSGTPGFTDSWNYTNLSPTVRTWSIDDHPLSLTIQFAVTPGASWEEVTLEIDENFSTFYTNTTGAPVDFPGISIWDSTNTTRVVSITSPAPNISVTYTPEPTGGLALAVGCLFLADRRRARGARSMSARAQPSNIARRAA